MFQERSIISFAISYTNVFLFISEIIYFNVFLFISESAD